MSFQLPPDLAERRCPECGSAALEWGLSTRPSQQFLNQTTVLFDLGCTECSETVTIVGSDRVLSILNGLLPHNATYPREDQP